MNYYNEWDKGAAAWLRELIKSGLIPNGYVDERSITEVTPSDLEGFTQCHFFAGIGGWPLALQLAGVPESARLWTGSPPCQPFSVAGQSLGFDDQRHLAPALLRLIRECKPQLLFGEQVAAAVGKHWLDFVFLNLEEQGYTCGAAVLPACSVGAPHKRDRLFFGAHLELANTAGIGRERRRSGETGAEPSAQQRPERLRDVGSSVADTNHTRPQGRGGVPERADQQPAGPGSVGGGVAQPDSQQQRPYAESGQCNEHVPAGRNENSTEVAGLCVDSPANPHNSYWSDADWIGCRDGKFRPVESGTFPLANGVPARVGRLRGYGNAIVPQAAAEFIKAFTGAITDAGK